MRERSRRWLMAALAVGIMLICASPGYPAGDSWISLRYQAVVKGGIMMIPIILCSILMLGFAIERLVMMRPDKIVPLAFVKKIRALVSKKEYEEALDLCKSRTSPIASVFRVALTLNRKTAMSNEIIRETVEDLGARELDDVALKIRPLRVIGSITPLLGLLGTVMGMIKAFDVVASEAGLGRADLLASGISEALITTAAGLLVAIPSLAIYQYFRARLEGKISERMEISLRMFLEDLFEGRAEK